MSNEKNSLVDTRTPDEHMTDVRAANRCRCR
jgi:hypothetical protein